ncbi:AGAP005416-PA-like protein [Anopheles sinensis]|uniref:AGAP005416-PA-like protein n=1 Tax=Anopheles sinensis TaxID=74873 RepID=A0A084WDB4_ANOSI|nr:AGAP005416-PA-like protein [Anopheles sinensis]
MLVFGALLVSLMLTGEANGNPLAQGVAADGVPMQGNEEPALSFQSRVGMVQTLTCTNPNCLAQCRGRGYRRGSCQIGRCFCSYV